MYKLPVFIIFDFDALVVILWEHSLCLGQPYETIINVDFTSVYDNRIVCFLRKNWVYPKNRNIFDDTNN